MPSYSIIENFEVHKNNRFLEIAEALKPELLHKEIKAEKEIMVGKDRQMRTVITEEHPIENLYAKSLKRDDTVFVDFGDHAVGYVTLELSKTGSHQDAPVYFYLKFGERLEEMTDKTADYDGWLSRGWIQEEYIHVDVLPAKVKLPRRYGVCKAGGFRRSASESD